MIVIAAFVTVCFPTGTEAATLDVAEHGAVPDDGADDAAAINAVLQRAAPGDTVQLPEGAFELHAPLLIGSGIRLVGAGQDRTRLVFAGEDEHELIRIVDARAVEVSGLTLCGEDNPRATQGIVANKAQDLWLHHLTVRDFVASEAFGPHAIKLSATSGSRVEDNTLLNIAPTDPWGAGIRASGPCSGNRILRNVIRNTGRGGIFTDHGATDSIIRENVVDGSHGIAFAIEVHSGSDRTVVEDNVVDHGLSIVSGQCAIRRNVVVDLAGTWGMYGIEGGGGPNGIVTDNVIQYGQIQGISLSGPQQYMLWARNTFQHASQWAMQIQGTPGPDAIRCLYFEDNTFARTLRGHPSARYPGSDGHGIRLNRSADHLVFHRNRFLDNAGLAIQIVGGSEVEALRFVGNTIIGNGDGVMSPYPGQTLVWEDNLVAGNGGSADAPRSRGDAGTPPDAAFDVPASARVGEPVTPIDRSQAGDAPLDHWLWDFGDGLPATERQPQHVYERPGLYRVTLVVWDADGRGAKARDVILRVEAE